MHIVLMGPVSIEGLRIATSLALKTPLRGRGQSPVVPLAAELLRRGHRVTLITCDENAVDRTLVVENELTLVIVPFRSVMRSRALSFYREEIAHLRAALDLFKPDIVHAHWTYEYMAAATRCDAPLLVTAHDAPFKNMFLYRRIFFLFRYLLALRYAWRVTNIACVSPILTIQMRMIGIFKRCNIIVNAIDTVKITFREPSRRFDRRLNIAVVGNGSDLKNVLSAVKATQYIRARFPHVEMQLYGEDIESIIPQPPLGVCIRGLVSHAELMRELHDHTDLLIHPSLYETGPVTILEAFAIGIPVVAGVRSGNVPYLFDTPVLQFCLTDIKSPEAIAERAIALLELERYNAIVAAARERVVQQYDIHHHVDQYVQLYARIISKRQHR